MPRRKEYLFTHATGCFYSRNKGDKTTKSVKRIKRTSLTSRERLTIMKHAGTWGRK